MIIVHVRTNSGYNISKTTLYVCDSYRFDHGFFVMEGHVNELHGPPPLETGMMAIPAQHCLLIFIDDQTVK